jgi:hypothetical protein
MTAWAARRNSDPLAVSAENIVRLVEYRVMD